MDQAAALFGWPGVAAELRTALAFGAAFLLGTLIGFERQWRQRTAGLRTNVLVAVGAAAFADMGLRLRGVEGGTQIISYVVSGIGFLGAGVILKDGTNIRGLNTAATLWCSAAVGAFSGSGLAVDAVLLTAAVLGANTLLRPLVNWVNRRPITADVTEAQYQVHVVCRPEAVSDVRDLLDAELAGRATRCARSRRSPTARSKSNSRRCWCRPRLTLPSWTRSWRRWSARRWSGPRPGA